MDVPSPIDFSRFEEAVAWAEAANLKRPWRADFFAAIVEDLGSLGRRSLSVLELGSGPGFLAEAVVRAFPDTQYTLLDSSGPMHDLARARLGMGMTGRFVSADLRNPDWTRNLGSFDAVLTVQAVHELRHKDRAVDLHKAVGRLLRPGGLYLVCDHVLGPGGMGDGELYMTASEQAGALRVAGFQLVTLLLETGGLVLHRATAA